MLYTFVHCVIYLANGWIINRRKHAILQDVSDGYKFFIKSDFIFKILEVLGDSEG